MRRPSAVFPFVLDGIGVAEGRQGRLRGQLTERALPLSGLL
ncbi:hypothetical protein [Streptomyces sp. NBC_01445]|nr:hypothetical protein [Streptomyces sp. NBC_01445]WSE11205.1 hypothetical protein OG574_48885 [Streptomyces sp. NBC_01445]